jgi:hypothetical protein
MTPVWKKLNLKDQSSIVVINAPAGFEPELAALEGVAIARDADQPETIAFSLVFVTRLEEIEDLSARIAAKAPGDALVWFAYPKASSKKYKCEFNRDTGWAALGKHGFEPVRQVAIDEDWSALRFRRVEYIKTLKRDASWVMSEAGQRRTKSGE